MHWAHNHVKVAAEFGMKLTDVGDWMRTPLGAVLSAAWWWTNNGCNKFADARDIDGCTRRINGRLIGIDDRRAKWAKARALV